MVISDRIHLAREGGERHGPLHRRSQHLSQRAAASGGEAAAAREPNVVYEGPVARAREGPLARMRRRRDPAICVARAGGAAIVAAGERRDRPEDWRAAVGMGPP